MTSRLIVSLAAATLTLFSATAFADGPAAGVQRNANQQARIAQGLKSGELTNHEAARLERGQARVSRMQAGALRDGQVTPAERARIDNAQDRQSRRIFRQKHDAQTKG